MDYLLTSLQFYARVRIRRPENESENFGGKVRWYVKLPGTGNDPVCYGGSLCDWSYQQICSIPLIQKFDSTI